MREKDLILLLQIIAVKGHVASLRKRGYEYHQIIGMVDKAVIEKYAEYENDILILTTKGKHKIRSDGYKSGLRKDGGWVSTAEEFRTEKSNIFKVYLPKTFVNLINGRKAR